MTAPQIEALTQGQTFTIARIGEDSYGMESFFPGRRVIWQDATRCIDGRWQMQGDQICFLYADKADRPVCWQVFAIADGLHAIRDGDPQKSQIRMVPTAGPALSCAAWLGS